VEVVVNGPLIANDYPTLVGAACDGVGLAQLPEPMALQVLEAGLLVRVLPKASVMTPGAFFCITQAAGKCCQSCAPSSITSR
jgi:DNA-binding transcriptional LysR family regulator